MRRFALFVGQLLLVLVGIMTGLFFLLRMAGDPVAILAGPTPTPEQVQAVRESLGLDDPLIVQYGRFVAQTARLDFGRSIRYGRPAFQMVLERVPATLQLGLTAIALSLIIAIPLGIFAAVRRGHPEERAIMLFAAMGQAMPNFWLAIVLILIFAVTLRWLPTFGSGEPRHLVLPAITLAALYIARMTRLVRSEMLETLSQDYIRTARAKGLTPRAVLVGHALRNSLIPVVTALSLDFSLLLSGAVVVETVFTYNGVGRQLVDSIFGRDYPVVQATVFLIAIIVVLVNYFTDWLYRLIDPRIQRSAANG
jgi:ABC-type dipeptide/oligopeptide/nickel transport system permease component